MGERRGKGEREMNNNKLHFLRSLDRQSHGLGMCRIFSLSVTSRNSHHQEDVGGRILMSLRLHFLLFFFQHKQTTNTFRSSLLSLAFSSLREIELGYYEFLGPKVSEYHLGAQTATAPSFSPRSPP